MGGGWLLGTREYSHWFIIIFFFILKKIFNCFILFFQSKKISHIINYVFFCCFIFFRTWTFHHYILWEKLVDFFKKIKVYYTPWNSLHSLKGNSVCFKQYWDFRNYLNHHNKIDLQHIRYFVINQIFYYL